MAQQLKDHSLRQLSDTYLAGLKPEELLHLSKKLLHDLKEAREQLNQNSNNSSKPPSSRAPWEVLRKTETETEEWEAEPEESAVPADASTTLSTRSKTAGGAEAIEEAVPAPAVSKRKQGKQTGAPGHGRTWQPPITTVLDHQASQCEACGLALGEDASGRAYTAYDTVDIEFGIAEQPGLRVITTRHRLYESLCACGHSTRYIPHIAASDSLYPKTEVGEWRLIGPRLASLIVHLRLRSRLSARRSQEFLREVLGIPLSVGVLQQCFTEAAAGAAPLEDALVSELLREASEEGGVLHVDETTWKERGETFWLWTFVTTLTVCFWVGRRTIEMLDNASTGSAHRVIGSAFGGWLMRCAESRPERSRRVVEASDGFSAYRHHPNRLRCWAHFIRKARGLVECMNKDGRAFGTRTLDLLGLLQSDIYAWREAGGMTGQQTDAIRAKHQQQLAEFREHCIRLSLSEHDKTAALAKEFINDWDAILVLSLSKHSVCLTTPGYP